VYIPAASLYENEKTKAVIQRYRDLIDDGVIKIVSGENTGPEFLYNKIMQYPKELPQGQMYREMSPSTIVPLTPKNFSTWEALAENWNNPATLSAVKNRQQRMGAPINHRLLERWNSVPDFVQGKAFVLENVAHALDLKGTLAKTLRPTIHEVI